MLNVVTSSVTTNATDAGTLASLSGAIKCFNNLSFRGRHSKEEAPVCCKRRLTLLNIHQV